MQIRTGSRVNGEDWDVMANIIIKEEQEESGAMHYSTKTIGKYILVKAFVIKLSFESMIINKRGDKCER